MQFGPIDGPFGTVGVANSIFSGSFFVNQSTITFDSAESWTFSSVADSYIFSGSSISTTFYAVALHEIGHTLGLDHPTNPSVILSATITPNITDLTISDIAGAQAIYGAESNQADLDITTALQLSSASVVQGTDVTINYDVKNVGNGPVGASTAGIYLSTDGTISTSDTLLTTVAVAAIDANGSASEGLTVATSGIEAGSYFLGIIPDYNNAIPESNESNNPSDGISFTVTSSAITSLTVEQQTDVVKLYLAYFNRAPETDGQAFHTNAVLTDLSFGSALKAHLPNVPISFLKRPLQCPSFLAFSTSQPLTEFVSTIYSNVLLRPGSGGNAPTPSDVQFWADRVSSGEISRGQMVTEFLKAVDDLKTNGTAAEQTIANQVDQVLQNRLTVALEFAKAENSGSLIGEAAFNAGKAVLDGVDATQASVDAALAELAGSTAINSSAVVGFVSSAEAGITGPDAISTDVVGVAAGTDPAGYAELTA